MGETITLKQVYGELKRIEKNMATKREVESIRETLEIMNNPKTMQQIAESIEDIREGRVKRISSVKDLLYEM